MTEELPTEAASAAPAPAKVPRKKTAPRSKKRCPTLSNHISCCLAESKEKKGTSSIVIKKCLATKGVDVVKENKRINRCIKMMVTNGEVVQICGKGASGSFKIAKTAKIKPGKKAVKVVTASKVKKPAAKKTQKTAKKVILNKETPKRTPKKKIPKKTTSKKTTPKKTIPKKMTPKKMTPKRAPKRTPKKTIPKKTTPKKTNPKAKKKPAAKKPAKKPAPKKK